jgi:hypothetical protein
MSREAWIVTLSILALLPLATLAQGAPGESAASAQRPSFDHRDADGDGAISLEEDRAFRKRDFLAADADADGRLTQEEYAAFLSSRHRSMDKAADGHLTREEVLAWGVGGDYRAPAQGALPPPRPSDKGVFSAVDQNADGRLSREEFEAYGRFRTSEEDVDGDGKADPAELRRVTEMYFKAMDRNADGFHSLEEHMIFWFGPPGEAAAEPPQPEARKP